MAQPLIHDIDEALAEAPRADPGDGAPTRGDGSGQGDPERAAPAAGAAAASAEPWLGATRRQAAEQEFDTAVLPLRRLYTNMAVEMALHRDVDRMRGEMLQELRMEVARLKGSVLSQRTASSSWARR